MALILDSRQGLRYYGELQRAFMSAKPPLSQPISLRLPADVLSSLESVARASDRPRSWIIVRALRRYLATEGSDILEAVEGRNQIASGEAHDLNDVIVEVEHELRTGGGRAA